jgi:hypothetical protein
MTVIRIGGILQPAWARTSSAVVGTTSRVATRLQSALDKTAIVSHDAALAVSALLTPVAVIALVFGMWRLGEDIGWTGDFVISNGLFSHWQVWIALSIAMQALASMLSRPAEAVQKSENPGPE